MKKRWAAAILLAGLLLSLTGCRSEPTPLSFWLKKTKEDPNGTYVCIGFKEGKGTDLEELAIPSSYKGIPVTGIYNGAFQDNQHLKKIVIPDTITAIDSGAFYNSAIEELVIPASVRWKTNDREEEFSLYESVQKCEQLRTLVIQYPITEFIGLSQCDNLEKLQLPGTVTSFHAFGILSRLSGLTDVYFEGPAEQWMNVEMQDDYGEMDPRSFSDQELIIHCTDATMRYEGIFFQEFLEFDGAWWLESTILPDYYEGVEMPVQEEPAEEKPDWEEPERRKAVSMDDLKIARIRKHIIFEDGRINSSPLYSYDYLYDEQGRVVSEKNYMYHYLESEMTYGYDSKGRATTCHQTEWSENETFVGDLFYEYNSSGDLIRIEQKSTLKDQSDNIVNDESSEYVLSYDSHGTLTEIKGYYSGGGADPNVYGPYQFEYDRNGDIIGTKIILSDGEIQDTEISTDSAGEMLWNGYFLNLGNPEVWENGVLRAPGQIVFPNNQRSEYDSRGRLEQVYRMQNSSDDDSYIAEWLELSYEYKDDGSVFSWEHPFPGGKRDESLPVSVTIFYYEPLGEVLCGQSGEYIPENLPENYYFGDYPHDD